MDEDALSLPTSDDKACLRSFGRGMRDLIPQSRLHRWPQSRLYRVPPKGWSQADD